MRGGRLHWAARAIAALALWQLASGLSNVVLGWPLLGAVAHTGGAAGLVSTLIAACGGDGNKPSSSSAQSGSPASGIFAAPKREEKKAEKTKKKG